MRSIKTTRLILNREQAADEPGIATTACNASTTSKHTATAFIINLSVCMLAPVMLHDNRAPISPVYSLWLRQTDSRRDTPTEKSPHQHFALIHFLGWMFGWMFGWMCLCLRLSKLRLISAYSARIMPTPCCNSSPVCWADGSAR